MPTDDSPRTRVHSGGTGLAAARELSSTNAAREAKLAGSKVSESKRVAAEAKVSHEEKVSAPSEEAESVGGAGGSREGSSSARRAAGHGEQKTQGASGRVHEEGEVMLPQTVSAQRIMDGFRIVKMNMSDAQTGEVLWESGHWEGADFEREVKASVPTRILECKEVAREITFYSKEMIQNFRLEQRVFFQGMCIEEWLFEFGFVIPGSKKFLATVYRGGGRDVSCRNPQWQHHI
eukprot:INCI18811.2.p1 GENE.INCI18811.2~~INCI18811.2.p1  ORF type:complete len:234 (+),score=31.03 INCI18811.2:301-1002(+)